MTDVVAEPRTLRDAPGPWKGVDPYRLVHNSAYDEATFQHELETIFAKTWLFMCHESEIREPGQYLRRQMPSGDPVVVLRDPEGTVRAFHNVCPHRGTLVVVEEEGCSRSLVCPYHNWCFNLDGGLRSVPFEEAYDGSGFAKENFGLEPVEIDTLFGLVFVRATPGGPSLRDYLGPEIVSWLERPFNDVELEVYYRTDRLLKTNWKGFAENARDGYHVPFVHKFLAKGSPPGKFHLYPSGHQVQRIINSPKAVDAETWEESTAFPFPGFERGEGYLAVVFPDLVITPRTNVVEIFSQTPHSKSSTLMEIRALAVRGDTPEQRRARERGYDVWLSNQPDEDAAIMEAQEIGLRSQGSRVSLIARGEDAVEGTRGNDARIRQFWDTWRQMTGLQLNAGVDHQDWLSRLDS